jgi:hypothetical protein
MKKDTLYHGYIGYEWGRPYFSLVAKDLDTFEKASRELLVEAKQNLKGEVYETKVTIYGPTEEDAKTVRKWVDKMFVPFFDRWLANDETKEPFFF